MKIELVIGSLQYIKKNLLFLLTFSELTMKKITLLLLTILAFNANAQLKLKDIEKSSGAGYCIITNTAGVQTYTPCSSLTSSVIPTLQSVLNAGSTSTTGITLTDAPLELNGNGAPYQTYMDAGYLNVLDFNGNNLLKVDGVGNYDASNPWVYIFNKKVVTVNSTDTLTNKTIVSPTFSTATTYSYATVNTVPYFDASKNLKSVSLGSGLSLNSGTLSATRDSTINYINVKDYGATGNGSTDDYTAINNAITASIARSGQVNLIFPYGTYLIGTSLSIDNSSYDVNIIGNNAYLKNGIASSSTNMLFIQSAKRIKIRDLNFDLNASAQTNVRALRVGDNTNSKYVGVCDILNCDFFNFGSESQYGIWFQNTPYISGLAGNQNLPSITVDGCDFYKQNTTATVNYSTMTNYGIGIRVGEQSDYAKITNCNFNYIRIGVYSEAGANLDITQCNFLACLPKQSGAYTYGAIYVPNTGTNNGKINVVACKFNHNYGYSIYYAYATAERPLTVSGCHFIANATTPIYMTHTSTISTQSMIQNNYFERCSQAYTNSWTNQPFGSTLQPFIYLNNQLNVTVKNNKFLNDASYAVQSANNSDYTTAQLNQISNTTGTYSLTGSNNILETGSDKLVYSLSPALTGTPTAPTAVANSSNTAIATTEYVDRAVAAVPGGGDLLAANNLSDVASATTSRNNILPSKTGNSLKILRVNASETDYELFTSGAGTGDLVSTNNLSDVANSITSLNNLGLQNLYLTADQTNTASATPAATTLSFTATANKKYAISGYLHIGCNNTGGVKIQVTIPAGATMNVSTFGFTTSGTAVAFGTISASATLGTAYCTLSSVGGQLKIDGTIEIAGTGGTVSIEFAPGTNTQTATVYKLGTNVLVRKLD